MIRLFNKYFIFSCTIIILLSCSNGNNSEIESYWKQADEIFDRIIPPTFQDKDFNITSYGAVGDGITDCTEAFKLAIDDCSNNGGGKVIVPQGTFLTGAIHLKSNVNLYIPENAIVKFSNDKTKYLPLVFSRWEGVECINYSALIYAYDQSNLRTEDQTTGQLHSRAARG